ncbi:MAG TPA: hypothetical protein PLN24_06260, partial [Victivallales bacterium]|nr:hypothetical protein [Victivallales bacterium]
HLVKISSYNQSPFKINNIESKKFGDYDNALQNFKFDALVLQPYQWFLNDKEHYKTKKNCPGDFSAISSFVRYASGENPTKNIATKRFVIYETWPRINGIIGRKSKNFTDFYNSPYDENLPAFNVSQTVPVREYTLELMKKLSKQFPDCEFRLAPVGEIFAKLDELIRTGKLPGIKEYCLRNSQYYKKARSETKNFPFNDDFKQDMGILNLYADLVHMNDQPHNGPEDGTLGAYIAAITLFSVLTDESPIGLQPEGYTKLDKKEDARLLTSIQNIVYEIIINNPMTGIKKGVKK